VRIAGGRRLQGTLRHVTVYMDDSCTANMSLIGVYLEGLNAFSRTMAYKLTCISSIRQDGIKAKSAQAQAAKPHQNLPIREDKANGVNKRACLTHVSLTRYGSGDEHGTTCTIKGCGLMRTMTASEPIEEWRYGDAGIKYSFKFAVWKCM
jgi:hypothetical protein